MGFDYSYDKGIYDRLRDNLWRKVRARVHGRFERQRFYRRFLTALRDEVFHDGTWQALTPRPLAPEEHGGNNFVAFQWVLGEERRVVVVNLAAPAGACRVPLKMPGLSGHFWRLRDLLAKQEHDLLFNRLRNGNELSKAGCNVEMKPYGYHLLNLEHQQDERNRTC